METAAFDYDLPEPRIAQRGIEPRDAARLLVDRGDGADPAVEHRHVRDLPDLVDPGDVVVVNDTRVLHARLAFVKPTGGAVEVLLLEPRLDVGADWWEALVRPGRRVPPGTELVLARNPALLGAEVGEDLGDGVRLVRLSAVGTDVVGAVEQAGTVPLPPYLHHDLDDPERYQTVFGDRSRPESVAAPTAGLHLTESVLAALEAKCATVARVDLVVGLGTFRPIATALVEDHVMHAERYRVPAETMAACDAAHAAGGRVVAVGTTAVRALESAAATGELDGRTELFIHDGFEFQVVDRLMTNFHLPRSSLLAMIDAFVGPTGRGERRWRQLYDVALAGDYRFLSFGDAMLLTRYDRW